jgi:RNA polymerase sigma factor (sigma-70 family)
MSMSDETLALVRLAIGGDRKAVRLLVEQLGPSVRVAVARVLYRYRPRSERRDLVQEAEDMTQEVFLALFEAGGRVLASWDPTRGASLETFVRLVAERTTLSLLRSKRRSPFTEEATLEEDLEAAAATLSSFDERVEAHDMLVRLHDRLKATLSERGYALFVRLLIEETPADQVAKELSMEPGAVYAWKYRFTKTVRAALEELQAVPSSRPVLSPGATA